MTYQDMACPVCGPSRRSPANKVRKVMRVWFENGKSRSFCIRCGTKDFNELDHFAFIPKPKRPKKNISSYIWDKSIPLKNTLAEAYLSRRGCLPCDSLRFLPATDKYREPSMVARFSGDAVHLTKLKPDATRGDKIILGPCRGLHIDVGQNDSLDNVIITEGIEDAISCAMATGWATWAAGSASNIPSVISGCKFTKIYDMVDEDIAGQNAFNKSQHPYIVPVRLSKIYGHGDANQIAQERGLKALLAAIEWSGLQESLRRNEISSSAMMKAGEWALAVINEEA